MKNDYEQKKKKINKITFLIFFGTLLNVGGTLPGYSMQQQEVVRGQVTDAGTGEILPGVNMQILNISPGTVTDVDGQYSLKIPSEDAVLIFSFIRYYT